MGQGSERAVIGHSLHEISRAVDPGGKRAY